MFTKVSFIKSDKKAFLTLKKINPVFKKKKAEFEIKFVGHKMAVNLFNQNIFVAYLIVKQTVRIQQFSYNLLKTFE